MKDGTKKRGLFAKIATRDDALKTIRDAALGFFFLAALQGAIGFFIARSMLWDAAILAILAAILMKWHSRTAAVLLLLLSIVLTVVTVLNRIGVMAEGGTNVILAVITLVIAVRAVQATFKLHSTFAPSRVS